MNKAFKKFQFIFDGYSSRHCKVLVYDDTALNLFRSLPGFSYIKMKNLYKNIKYKHF